jgi:hypothetical protein
LWIQGGEKGESARAISRLEQLARNDGPAQVFHRAVLHTKNRIACRRLFGNDNDKCAFAADRRL